MGDSSQDGGSDGGNSVGWRRKLGGVQCSVFPGDEPGWQGVVACGDDVQDR